MITLADKSESGWSTVNEYLSDELPSDFDDEKRMYRAKRRAEELGHSPKARSHKKINKIIKKTPPAASPV